MRTAIAIVALVAATLVAGCSPQAPEPTAFVSPPETAGPTETPEPGSAEALLPDFQAVLDEVDAAHDVPDGDALVEALVDAGFDAAAIERTSDVDSLGEPVTLLEVAVRVDESCLVGQVGQGEPTALVMPRLSSGACLVGATVPVD